MTNLEHLSNIEIVAFVVGELDGAVSSVEFDDIALKSFTLAPKRFGWIKVPKQVDLRVVWAALADACKRDKGLLTGDSQRGYMLTRKGLTWYEKIDRSSIGSVDKGRKGSEINQLDIEKRRLYNTAAYKKYKKGETSKINLIDYQEFTRINEYFPNHVVKQRFARIENSIRGDEELEALWQVLLERFARRKT